MILSLSPTFTCPSLLTHTQTLKYIHRHMYTHSMHSTILAEEFWSCTVEKCYCLMRWVFRDDLKVVEMEECLTPLVREPVPLPDTTNRYKVLQVQVRGEVARKNGQNHALDFSHFCCPIKSFQPIFCQSNTNTLWWHSFITWKIWLITFQQPFPQNLHFERGV